MKIPFPRVRQASLSAYRILLATAVLLGMTVGCKQPAADEIGKKVLHIPLLQKVGTLDPVRGSSSYASRGMAPVYEPLLQYNYLKRPLELEPNLLAKMPTVSEDGLVYSFELLPGVLFADDPCFKKNNGRGREVTAEDVIYSIKRMADRSLSPAGWWIYNGRIKGFDAYKEAQAKRAEGTPFDYKAKVEGLKILGRYTFEIVLNKPYPQLLYILAMNYTSVVAREAVEHYGDEFGSHPVGTGPFKLRHWSRGSELVFDRNPNYRDVFYPEAGEATDKENGLLKHTGKKVPMLDGVHLHVFEQAQPAWLKWRVKDVDWITVPAEFHDAIFNPDWTLRDNFVTDGIRQYNLKLLDFIYRGFNMQDPVVGGEKGKPLRQAISLALDTNEMNDAFYNNTCVTYDGPIPPGLEGHKEGINSPYRGPNIEKAKELLVKAGYPGGKGLPPLQFETSIGGNTQQQAEMFTRQLKKVGVVLEPNFNSFPELTEKLNRKKAQMFGLAWGSDYPDAENNLALFYGPNSAGGMNNFSYMNPAYDKLYEAIQTMQPGPERTAIYEQMRDMLIEDCPSIGSMARTRFYVWNPRLDPMKPSETWYTWIKYLNVEARTK